MRKSGATCAASGAQLQTWKAGLPRLLKNRTRAPRCLSPSSILKSGDAVGSTRYFTIAAKDRGLEIGSTWLAPSVWRTAINSEAKYLLLEHAFETLGCIRVQFITDSRNERSRRAIERLGATFEGTIRHHMIMRDGCLRDSLLFSILDSEWPTVKQRLASKLYGRSAAA
jgi:RimJ/RimL family protein N-acetyltransferase